jgi:hypothetical protein
MITPEQLAKSGTEHGAQAALFFWASMHLQEYPQLRALFAIPNGGLRHPATAARLAAEGVRKGVPDIMLAVPKNIWADPNKPWYCGLFIELKIGTNKPTKEQQEWLYFLSQSGYRTHVCYGWEEARDKIISYLS